jgi:hypothetical protein
MTDPGVVNIHFERCPDCGELSVEEMEIGEMSSVNVKWKYRKSFPPCDHFIVDSFEVRRGRQITTN